MGTFLANLIGAYLLIGVVLYGFSSLAQARWIASGQMKPPSKRAKRLRVIGTAIGVLLWPLGLIVIPIWRWKSRQKAIKYMGFCEHATAWEPVCRSCRLEMDVEKNLKNAVSQYVQGGSARLDIVAPKTGIRTTTEEEIRKRLAEIEISAASLPDCPRKRKIDLDIADLKRQVEGLSDLQRQIEALTPTSPGDADSCYVCSNCGDRRPGFPPDVDRDGKPLCINCRR